MIQAENILFTAAMAGYFGTMILYFCFAALRKELALRAVRQFSDRMRLLGISREGAVTLIREQEE